MGYVYQETIVWGEVCEDPIQENLVASGFGEADGS
jgi:hypothetical protein